MSVPLISSFYILLSTNTRLACELQEQVSQLAPVCVPQGHWLLLYQCRSNQGNKYLQIHTENAFCYRQSIDLAGEWELLDSLLTRAPSDRLPFVNFTVKLQKALAFQLRRNTTPRLELTTVCHLEIRYL